MLDVESYTVIAQWFPRLLGIIYFFTFSAFIGQVSGLIGENGILPLGQFLNHIKTRYPTRSFWLLPTIFWWDASNRALLAVTVIGSILSLCLLLGFAPPLMLLLLYILYLSIVSAGQEFLSFGWEGFLLEITANAFLLSLTVVPNVFVWLSLNLLLFRFHVMAGIVKLQSRDPNWRNQTAVAYHYQTQPLPNTVAWYIHKFPLWFHKLSCFSMFACELGVPFGIFFGQDIRLVTFVGLAGLQYFIWLTGNLSFLNHLTLVFCTILLNNAALGWIGMVPPSPEPTSLWLETAISSAAAILIALQVGRSVQKFVHVPFLSTILGAIGPFYLANPYGIFAVMTTKRYEIIVEGSHDGVEWKEYTFWYKPSEVTCRPKRVSPYQPRLDWRAWFLPFTKYGADRWFTSFLYHLLVGTPEVVKLLKGNPFPGQPPRFVRALAYDYVFSSFEERKAHGWWWRRTYIGTYSPVITLNRPRNSC